MLALGCPNTSNINWVICEQSHQVFAKVRTEWGGKMLFSWLLLLLLCVSGRVPQFSHWYHIKHRSTQYSETAFFLPKMSTSACNVFYTLSLKARKEQIDKSNSVQLHQITQNWGTLLWYLLSSSRPTNHYNYSVSVDKAIAGEYVHR